MISFIVPIYNAAEYLPACIESLVHQTEKELQILLIDDGSTDDSLSIARSYAKQDPRITVLQQAHAGQSAARNLGMAHATGEYIAFVDADDTIESDWSEQHLKAIVGVDYVQSQKPRNQYQFTVVWGRLYRRQAIEHLRFAEGMIYEDILFSVDLWLSGATCRIIPYSGYHYTLNPNSTTSRPHPEAGKQVLRALRNKTKGATLKERSILWYTIIRLYAYFLLR